MVRCRAQGSGRERAVARAAKGAAEAEGKAAVDGSRPTIRCQSFRRLNGTWQKGVEDRSVEVTRGDPDPSAVGLQY